MSGHESPALAEHLRILNRAKATDAVVIAAEVIVRYLEGPIVSPTERAKTLAKLLDDLKDAVNRRAKL